MLCDPQQIATLKPWGVGGASQGSSSPGLGTRALAA